MTDPSHSSGGEGRGPATAPGGTAPARSAPEVPGGVERGGAASDREGDEADAAEALVGTTLADRYRIEELLGTGGMGAVYRGQHIHMKKNVAVKVLHREMTYLPEVVARFEREAVAAARIEHPNVAGATDFGRIEGGAFYLVLEFVEGTSLRDLLKEHGALNVPLALHISRQMADALSAAHAAEIVHRDLKPDNVMLIEREGDPHFVKVLDFGIAKVSTDEAGPALTQLGSVFGTPEYMSPEQASGTPVDARSDLYTLGILLYEMLSGNSPFDDEDMVVVLTRQMTMGPAPLPPSVPADVQALVARMLCKDADERVQTAAELVAQFDALLHSTPDPGHASPSAAVGSPPPPSMEASSVQYGDTVLSLARPGLMPGAAETPHAAVVGERRAGQGGVLAPLLERVPALAKPIHVGGQQIPLWWVAIGGAALVALSFVVVLTAALATSGGAGADGKATDELAAAAGPSLQEQMDLAKTGDREAIAFLQARPERKRTAPEWYALGRGLSVDGHVKLSLVAYEKAVGLDPALTSDTFLVKDIIAAAQSPATSADSLDLAVRALGATGADLVYEVYTRTKDRKGTTVHNNAKLRLKGKALRSKASPALLVVLDLNKARGCGAVKAVVVRAAKHADARASKKLKAYSHRRGCGFLGLRDCYGCLRGSTTLSDAIKRAKATPGPQF